MKKINAEQAALVNMISNIIPTENLNVEFNLFVVSPVNKRMTMLNLSNLSVEERKAKLAEHSNKNLVALIVLGNEVFLHKSRGIDLSAIDLDLKGKKVTVQDLSEDSINQLSKLVEVMEEEAVEETDEEMAEEKLFIRDHGKTPHTSKKTYRVAGLENSKNFIPMLVRRDLNKIIQRILENISEDIKKEKERKVDSEKFFTILWETIQKELRAKEIIVDSLKAAEKKFRIS